jgi:acyl-coenzyme A thioesterase PaaI-like protein
MPLLISLWPPFWFTGIKFTYISPDFRHIRVRMALRFYNKNIIGIQYGGNLFSMTDPCFMMMLMRNMGGEYRIIDKSASIEFVKPGAGSVTANCYLQQEDIEDIITATKDGAKYFKNFSIDITDQENEVIARVKRSVYIRKKQ